MATAPQADLYGKLKRYALANNFAKLWENKYMYEGRREIKLQGPDQRPVNFKNALEKMRKGNHVCVRCNEDYLMQTDGYYPGGGSVCRYHSGRQLNRYGPGIEKYWNCCGQGIITPGCSQSEYHVHSDNTAFGVFLEMGPNNNVQSQDFAPTPLKRGERGTVVAFDVEMIYTTGGLEVAKVTLLDQHLNVLIREFVKPTNQIFDYNTQFSGIKEEDIQRKNTHHSCQNDFQYVLERVTHALVTNNACIRISRSMNVTKYTVYLA